jgi:hypothetical protein
MPDAMVSFTQLFKCDCNNVLLKYFKNLETGFLLRNGQMQMQLVKVLVATYH